MHERRYSGDISRLRSAARRELLEVDRVVDLALNGLSPVNMLDIGTGSALFAEAFARQGLEISGIDANSDMVEIATQLVPQGHFKHAEAEKIPYPDRSFDLVFMGLVWHETDDPAKALREALRVCRKRLAILEWQYRDGAAGPPLADRISAQKAGKLIKRAGIKKYETKSLQNTVLYILNDV
jgi:ubiquinone/menaquinone biosynthesis C-methylase UbiE